MRSTNKGKSNRNGAATTKTSTRPASTKPSKATPLLATFWIEPPPIDSLACVREDGVFSFAFSYKIDPGESVIDMIRVRDGDIQKEK